MQTKRIAILFSGNGSNLEALIGALHKKYFCAEKLQECGMLSGVSSDECLISGIHYEFRSFDSLESALEYAKKYAPLKYAQDSTQGILGAFMQESQKEFKQESQRNERKKDSAQVVQELAQTAYLKHLKNEVAHLKTEPFCVEVALALSNKKDAYGLTRARNLGIPTRILESKGKSREAFDTELVRILEPLRLDLCVLAGFMRILTPIFTNKIKAINIHPSLLPLFKGANGIKDSYESQMRLGGVSVHLVSDELDSGEIIAQGAIAKNLNESLESYESRIHALEHKLYPQAVLRVLIDSSK